MSVLVIGVSLASFANMGWGFPRANQEFRTAAAGRPLVRGVNELTLGELRSLLRPGTHEPLAVAEPATREGIATAYYNRLALSFATLALVLFVCAVRLRASGRLATAAAVCAVSLGYYTLVYTGLSLAWEATWPAAVGAWFPNGVVALATMALFVFPRRQQPAVSPQ